MVIVKKQLLLNALVSIAVLSPASIVNSSAISITPAVQSPPTICKDANGVTKSGDLDVLLLLDNSKSLSESDEEGERFDAIKLLLESLANSERKNSFNNFGLITFGSATDEIVRLGPITRDNFGKIFETIISKVPNSKNEQEATTDYLAALNEGISILNGREKSNCKFIIWFTDGVFDISDSNDIAIDKSEAKKLQTQVCGENGLAQKFQNALINTFVVFLRPIIGSGYKGRSEASRDAMQAITGDKEPNFDGQSARELKAPCEFGVHLGEVFQVDEADKLKGFFTDFGPIANGGISISDDCPSIGGLVSKPLPNAEIIEWIAITSHNSEPPDPEKFFVRTDGQEGKFLDYFILKPGETLSLSRYFQVKPEKTLALAAGWQLKTEDSQLVCVFAKVRRIKFRIRNSDPRIEAIEPEGLSKDLFASDQLVLFNGDEVVTITEALNLVLVTGKLTVVNGEIFGNNRIPVDIVIDGFFSISPAGCKLKINHPEGVAPKGLVQTSTCDIVPAPKGETIVDAEKALRSLNKSCPAFVWQLVANGKPVATDKWTVPVGSNLNAFFFATSASAPNENLECNSKQGLDPVVVSLSNGKSQSENVGVSVQYKFLKDPSSLLVTIFTALFAILFAALSLAVLRLMNILIAKGPSQSDFFGYEDEAELVSGDYKRGELRWLSGSTKNYVADPDKLHQIKVNSQRTSLDVGSLRFSRELPPITRPFQEARLALRSKSPAVFWQANRHADGLSLGFGKALVISYVDGLSSKNEGMVRVKVTLLVPKRGLNAGISGVQQLISERGDEMASQLFTIGAGLGTKVTEKTESKQEMNNASAPQRAQVDSRIVGTEANQKPPEPPRSSQPPQPPQRSN